MPRREIWHVSNPYNAEPRDEVLKRQFERQAVKVEAQSVTPKPETEVPANDLSARLDRMLVAGQSNDWATFSRENQALAYGEAGRYMLERAALQASWLQQVQQQQAMPAPPLLQPSPGPVMQH